MQFSDDVPQIMSCLVVVYEFFAGPRSTVGSASAVQPHTFVFPSADLRKAVVRYWRKYVHEVLVNRLGVLRLPRKSVVRLTVST